MSLNNDVVPAVTVVQEMFESVSQLYQSGALNAPDGRDLDGYLKDYRRSLHAALIKKPPMKRISKPEQFSTLRATAFPRCTFVFFGEVQGMWVYLSAKLSPQSVDSEELFNNKEMLLAEDGWFYNIRYPGIRLGVFTS